MAIALRTAAVQRGRRTAIELERQQLRLVHRLDEGRIKPEREQASFADLVRMHVHQYVAFQIELLKVQVVDTFDSTRLLERTLKDRVSFIVRFGMLQVRSIRIERYGQMIRIATL